jgi:hypothetical protein
MLLAPALDTPWGHPAIWEKLLAHYAHEAARQQISRIYVDVPDQPLPVNTFSQVGFKLYTQQTIWRLTHHHAVPAIYPDANGSGRYTIHAPTKVDEWALWQLYTRVTPEPVQQAEGVVQYNPDQGMKPLILDWWQSGNFAHFVLMKRDEVQGSLLIGRSTHGYWLRLLVDSQQPNTDPIHYLLRYGLQSIDTSTDHRPIYIGVRNYHGGLNSILSDYGFAPFTDRARMVRHVPAWVHQAAPQRLPAVETVGEAIPTSFVLPKAPWHTAQSTARRLPDTGTAHPESGGQG